MDLYRLMLERTEILMVQMDGRGCRCTLNFEFRLLEGILSLTMAGGVKK